MGSHRCSLDDVDEGKLDAILERMNLNEKVGQLLQIDWRNLRPAEGAVKAAVRAATNVVLPQVSSLMWLHDRSRPLNALDADPTRNHMLGSVLGGGGAAPEPNVPEQWRAQSESVAIEQLIVNAHAPTYP